MILLDGHEPIEICIDKISSELENYIWKDNMLNQKEKQEKLNEVKNAINTIIKNIK